MVDPYTGEVIELNTPYQVKDAWLRFQSIGKAVDKAKKQLKQAVDDMNLENQVIEGHKFNAYQVTRRNYDKTYLREKLDEDTFDLMMTPNKKMVDAYIKENPDMEVLKQNMVEESTYQVIKLMEV